MAKLWSTGPALVYIEFQGIAGMTKVPGQANSALFLGTAEDAPEIDLIPFYRKVYADSRGQRNGPEATKAFLGETALVAVNLNRFNEPVLQQVQARPNHANDTKPGAIDDVNDVGTLIAEENKFLTVYVQFPYARFSAYSGMPPGYRFPGATPVGPDRLRSLGTNGARAVLLAFDCIEDDTGVLYDYQVGGLPPPN